MTNQCIKCKKEIDELYYLCTDCAKEAFSDNIFWTACDPLITEPVVNRFREHSETILTIGEREEDILFEQGETVEEEIKSFDPEKEKDYRTVLEKMNSILGEMGVTKELKKDDYFLSKKDVQVLSKLFLKIEKIERKFSDIKGHSYLYLRFGNLFFYTALKSDIDIFEPDFRDKIVNDMFREAEGFYTLSIRAEEGNATAHKNMGQLFLEKEEPERAIESINKSLNLIEDEETKKLLIKALIKSNKLKEAEDELDELEEDSEYWILKGDINKEKGGWGRAIQLYHESDLDQAIKKEAEQFLENERYEKALKAYDKYLEKRENDPASLKGKARCLFELDKKDESLNQINKSISLDGQDDEKWFILGSILEDKEELENAKDAFQNAVKLNPKNKEAKEKLETL